MDFSPKSLPIANLPADAIIDFHNENHFLSNFHRSPIQMYNIWFPTVEHAFAAIKIDPQGGVLSCRGVIIM